MDEITTEIIAGVHLMEPMAATSGTANPSQWLIDWVRGGTESASGVHVNGETALTYAPWWYGVNKIAGHVGLLPLIAMERRGEREKLPARRIPGYRLMKKQANQYTTAAIFKETLQSHALNWGNGRAAIIRNQRNDPAELIQLDPNTWDTVLVDGEKWHFTNSDPTVGMRRIHDDDVLHIAGLGFDGIIGYSVWKMARDSLGLGLAGEQASAKNFKNDAVPPVVLEAPPGVFRKETDAKQFLQDWNQYHAGVDNAGKAGLLREGIKANQLAMSSRDSQWIEQRVMQRQDAALWMALESILGDDSSVSYNSLEAKNQAYLTNCLMRWLNKWEEECEKKLLTETQQRSESHFFRFRTAALLRGTTLERYQVYQIGRQIEVFSANDVRDLEDMNEREGGDEYGNPAINPQGNTDEPPENNENDDETTQERLRSMINSRLTDVVEVESKRIENLAAKSKTMAELEGRVDDFYGKFLETLTRAYEACGGTFADAQSHVEASKAEIAQALSACESPRKYRSAVAEAAEKWTERITATTNELVKQ